MTFITSLSATVTAFAAPEKNFSSVMHKLEVESFDSGGTLIFSDSPEYVRKNGILYADTVSGAGRILFYHLNDTGVLKRLAVVVENVSNKKCSVKITRSGISSPSRNFLHVGKATQLVYMQGAFDEKIELKPRERKIFNSDWENIILNPGQLVYGVADFFAEDTVKIFVMMYPYNADPLRFIDSAEILPRDKYQLRGTFKNMNRTLRLKKIYNPERDGIGYVIIGDNVNDIFKTGIDATDGMTVTNYGNYGINYTLDFRTNSPTNFFLSPLGGEYAGVMQYKHGKEIGIISTPSENLYFGDKTPREPEHVQKAREEGLSILTNHTELAELGTYDGEVKFIYSPPGASNLPVNIVLTPIK